jgi:GNAT superfamily N-acetyltransferase
MKDLEIRLGTIDDLDELVRLRVLMQGEVNVFEMNDVTDEYVAKVRNYFESALQTKKYLSAVAVVDGRVVGTAGVCFYEKPPAIYGGSGIVGYVTNVYTEVEFRRKGIGEKMMAALVDLAKEVKADKLHLGATDDGISIYKSVGFQEPRFVQLECRLN